MIKIGSFDAAALDDVLGSQFVFFHSLVQIMAEDGCLHFVLPDICHLRELSGFLDDGQELGGGQLFFSIRMFHRASSGCNFHQQ